MNVQIAIHLFDRRMVSHKRRARIYDAVTRGVKKWCIKYPNIAVHITVTDNASIADNAAMDVNKDVVLLLTTNKDTINDFATKPPVTVLHPHTRNIAQIISRKLLDGK